MPAVVLTVAGSDPSGGAGVQADLRLFAREGLYGTAVIAGITVQDSSGVQRAEAVDADLVGQQLDAVLADLRVAAAKSGMLGSGANVRALAARIGGVPLVVDPVLVSTSGRRLLDDDGLEALRDALLPRAAITTPNLAEAAALLGVSDVPAEDAADAARALAERFGLAVVVTGGHAGGDRSVDCAWIGRPLRLDGPRIATGDDHGTGCLHSAAIAAGLARGLDLEAALRHGRAAVEQGLRDALRLGRGRGSVYRA
jgi:hydroxymethylpyrimidine/phosphomethylpyrimidine kinase